MSYSPRVYHKAQRILQGRRDKSENLREERHHEMTTKFPEITALEQEMAKCGLAVIRAVGRGNANENQVKALKHKSLAAQRRRAEILKENGSPINYLEVQYDCPACNDTGFVEGRMCRCLSNLLKQLTYEELSKSSPLQLSSFDTFNVNYYQNEEDAQTGNVPRKHMKWVLDYCENYAETFTLNSNSLLFYGATGLGKTHLSLAIAGKVIEKGYGVIYGTTQNLLNKLEAEKFGRAARGEESAQQMILECDLLLLDDLGTEFSTQFTVSSIYNVVNTRILANRPTIISTNLDPRELESQYAQRTTSRIIGSYEALFFCGRDIRQIKRSEQSR